MKTIRGIELNLLESEYTVKKDGYIFYFSSEFYKNKFEINVDRFILEENIKLKNKTKININAYRLFLFSYYKKIEKRGFRVIIEETKEEVSENAIFTTLIFQL